MKKILLIMTVLVLITSATSTTTTIQYKLEVTYSPEVPNENSTLTLYVTVEGYPGELVNNSFLDIKAPEDIGYETYYATNGTYTLTNPIAGTYAVYAWKPGFTNSDTIAIYVVDGETTTTTSSTSTSSTLTTTTSTSTSTTSTAPVTTTSAPETTSTVVTTSTLPGTTSTVVTTSTVPDTTTSVPEITTSTVTSTTIPEPTSTTSTSTSTSTSSTTTTIPIQPVIVTRHLPDQIEYASNLIVTLDFDVNESNPPVTVGITEQIPVDWIVGSISNGGIYKSDENTVQWLFWAGGEPIHDYELNYTLVVPENSEGTYFFSGFMDYVFQGETLNSTIDGDTELEVIPEICELVGDYQPCGDVTLSEVVDFIGLWSQGEVELSDVVALISVWAST